MPMPFDDLKITVVSEREVLHPTEAQGILIGKVMVVRSDLSGVEHEILFWYNYSAVGRPLHHIQ